MTRRLTAFFTIAVLGLLSVASLYLYYGLLRNVQRANQDLLTHKVQVLTRLIQESPPNRAGIEQEAHEEAEVSAESHLPFFLRVSDGDGRDVVATPGMDSVLPSVLFPSAREGGVATRAWRSDAGPSYVLSASEVAEGGSGALWQVHAAVDVSASERLLATFRRDIVLVLLAGLCLAAVMGAWLVRRNLRPLQAIAKSTESVDAERLEVRIGNQDWPAELVTVAAAHDRMMDRLQESFVRLQQFSADLAHELRTPINNLMGESQVALSRSRNEDEYVRVLQSSLEELSRLSRMIDSMLFLAHAEQAESALDVAMLDSRAQMQAVADFYQALADEQGVGLSVEGGGAIRAEAQLLRRALSNLVANALRYTPQGGRIVLAGAAAADGSFVIAVRDSGRGIEPQHLAKLGDRFYRVDPARTGADGGSGLGLAISRSIMALHGGRLEIHSVAGEGSTFSLVFPPHRT